VRYASEDLELGGRQIRAGESLLPILVAANSDPRELSDPERFDITRGAGHRRFGHGGSEHRGFGHVGFGHVGFGHGPHYCLGAALARQEAEVALKALFERFPALALTGEPEWAPIPGMLRLTRLPVRTKA
jgi:cytochrome P450